MVQMLDELPAEHQLGTDSVVFDLGSGVGKFIYCAAMVWGSTGVGIEIVPSRHKIAVETKAASIEQGLLSADEASRMRFVEGDAFAYTGLQDATHIYVANLCFTEMLDKLLLQALIQLAQPINKSLRCVVTLKEIRTLPERTAGQLKLVRVGRVGCTWDPQKRAFYYCTAQERAVGLSQPRA
jgi:hypothetical protein